MSLSRRSFLKYLGIVGSLPVAKSLAAYFPEVSEALISKQSHANQAFLPMISNSSDSDKVKVLEINGEAAHVLIEQVKSSSQMRLLKAEFDKIFEGDPEESQNVIQISNSNEMLSIVEIHAKNDMRSALFYFVISGDQFKKAGLSIFNGLRTIADIFEVEGHKLNVGRLEMDENSLQRFSESKILLDEYDIGEYKVATSRAIEGCSDCLQVCGVIHGLGCGLGGYVACAMIVCSTFLGVGCIICAAVWTAFCGFANGLHCGALCESLDYC